MNNNNIKDMIDKSIGYNGIKRERNAQVRSYDAKVKATNAQFAEQEKEIMEKYKADMDAICEKKKNAVNQIPSIVLSEEIVKELEEDVKVALEENKIDNIMMCNLLTQKTGKKWLPKIVTGLCSDMVYGGQLSRYGVILVNEDHPKFNSQVASYSDDQVIPEDNAIFVKVGGVWPVQERFQYQDAANNFNWMLVYLATKGALPSFEDKAHLPHGGKYNKQILEALEEYVEGKKLEEDSEEEMGE